MNKIHKIVMCLSISSSYDSIVTFSGRCWVCFPKTTLHFLLPMPLLTFTNA